MIIRRKVVGGNMTDNEDIEITPLRTDGMYMVPVRPHGLDDDDHTEDEVVFVPNNPGPPNLVFPPPSL